MPAITVSHILLKQRECQKPPNVSSKSFRLQGTQNGLTLVEIAVVAVLLALLGMILYSSLSGIIKAKESIQSQRVTSRTARFVLSRLARELRSALAEPLSVDGSSNESTKQTASSSKNPFMIASNSTTGTADNDAIQFISSSGAQAVFGGLANYGHVQLRYQLVANPDEKNPQQEPPRYLLVREETPANVENNDLTKQRRIVFPIASTITDLNFRFFNKDQWTNKWDGEQSGLPEAVEITLGVVGGNNVKQMFRTAIAVKPKRGSRPTGFSSFRGFGVPK